MGIQVRALPAGKPSVTTVEVEVNGQRVDNGAVISAVGPMTVTSPTHIRVIVDGVEWQPVSSASGTDTYALTVGGRVLMFDNNGIVFSFLNEVQPDFTYTTNIVRFNTPSGSITGGQENGRYVQTTFAEDATVVRVTTTPVNMESITGLTATCNQPEAAVTLTTDETSCAIKIQNFDITQPIQIYIGNVLLAYILPI